MFSNTVQSSLRIGNAFGDDFEQTTPLIRAGELRPNGEIAELSKSHSSQVVAGRSLPRVYVTSRIKVSARRSK